jgi:hypothetical protein
MRIKCRKKNNLPLTLNKEYIVLAIKVQLSKGISMLIQGDDKSVFFIRDGFEMIDQHKPSNWDTEINNETEVYYTAPKSWRYDRFLESLKNKDRKAVALFNTESEIIYREMK